MRALPTAILVFALVGGPKPGWAQARKSPDLSEYFFFQSKFIGGESEPRDGFFRNPNGKLEANRRKLECVKKTYLGDVLLLAPYFSRKPKAKEPGKYDYFFGDVPMRATSDGLNFLTVYGKKAVARFVQNPDDVAMSSYINGVMVIELLDKPAWRWLSLTEPTDSDDELLRHTPDAISDERMKAVGYVNCYSWSYERFPNYR